MCCYECKLKSGWTTEFENASIVLAENETTAIFKVLDKDENCLAIIPASNVEYFIRIEED
jgi:hypothetical protein